MTVSAAAVFPDRFAAVAGFNGGNLAIEAPTSPHLGAPRIEADVYLRQPRTTAATRPRWRRVWQQL